LTKPLVDVRFPTCLTFNSINRCLIFDGKQSSPEGGIIEKVKGQNHQKPDKKGHKARPCVVNFVEPRLGFI
jgi:hypothetical protein